MVNKNKLFEYYQKIFCRKVFFKFHNFLFRISLRGIGILNSSQSINGEIFFLNYFLKNITNPVVFDVGANRGVYSEMVKEINLTSNLYSFEPHPVSFKQLKTSALLHKYHAFQIALGNSQGYIEIYDYANQPGSEHASIYKEVIEDLHGGIAAANTVQIDTLDNFCLQKEISLIHI